MPSLYLGSPRPVLAARQPDASAGASARGSGCRGIVAASLVGSLGQYTSPIWAARLLAETTAVQVPDIGPLDTNDVTPIRLDRYLRDGDGGVYWWMTTLLPGFRQFRFPAKLLTFSTFGLAALAGMGWDDLQHQDGSAGPLALAASCSSRPSACWPS